MLRWIEASGRFVDFNAHFGTLSTRNNRINTTICLMCGNTISFSRLSMFLVRYPTLICCMPVCDHFWHLRMQSFRRRYPMVGCWRLMAMLCFLTHSIVFNARCIAIDVSAAIDLGCMPMVFVLCAAILALSWMMVLRCSWFWLLCKSTSHFILDFIFALIKDTGQCWRWRPIQIIVAHKSSPALWLIAGVTMDDTTISSEKIACYASWRWISAVIWKR